MSVRNISASVRDRLLNKARDGQKLLYYPSFQSFE